MKRLAWVCLMVAGCGGGGGEADAPGPADAPVSVDAPNDANDSYVPGDPFVLGADPGNDEDPAVLRARDESISVAWFSEAAGFDILVSRTTDGETWSTPVRVSTGPERDFGPTLHQDAAGFFHAVWFRWDAGAPPGHLMHARSTAADDISAWNPAEPVTTNGAWDDWVPSISSDGAGGMIVAFARNTCPPPDECYGIYTTTSADGTAWTTPVQVVPADATTEHHLPSIAYLEGTLLLAWDPFDASAEAPYDDNHTGSHISIMRNESGAWTGRADFTVRVDDEVSLFPHLFTSHGGAAWLLWLRGDTTGAVNVHLALGALDTEPGPLPTVAGYSARLVATPTPDRYLAAWVQGPPGERDVAVRVLTLD